MLVVGSCPHQTEPRMAADQGAQLPAGIATGSEHAHGQSAADSPHIYAIVMHIYADD
jgi:hypothetical protein